MIKEQFGFGVNTVSLEGAGKMYEVLAKNASQQAATAGANSSVAMGEYSRAIGQFNKYFQASHSTAQAANATASRANQALNQGRDGLNRSGKAQLALDTQRKQDVVTSINSLFRAGNAFAASLQQAKLQEGVVEGIKLNGELRNMADPDARLVQLNTFMAEYKKSPNDARLQGMSRSIFPLYGVTVDEINVNRKNTELRSIVTLADNSLQQSKDKLTINMNEIVALAKRKNIPVGEARDAVYKVIGGGYGARIRSAETPEDLKSLTNEWAAVVANNFDNDFFIRNKNEKTQKLITDTNRDIAAAIKQSKKIIKTKGQLAWVDIKKNPMSYTSKEIQESIDYQQLNPLEVDTKRAEVAQLNADQAKHLYFNEQFTDTTVAMGDMWKHAPKTTVEAAEYQIGEAGFKAFMTGGAARFQEILFANPGHVQEIGKNISRAFDGGTYNEKSAIYSRLMQVRAQTSASQATSQTLPDGDLARILTIGAMAKAMPAENDEQLKDNWAKAHQAFANTKGNVAYPLNPSTDRDLIDKINRDAVTMGNNAGRFRQMIHTIYGKNPDVAVALYDGLQEHFSNLSRQIDVQDFEGSFTITEDLAHAPDHFSNPKTGVQADKVEEAKSQMYQEVSLNFYNKNGYYPNIMGVTYLADGMVSLTDEFANTIANVPVQTFIDNYRTGEFAKREAKALAEKTAFQRSNAIEGKDVLNNVVNDFHQWVTDLSNAEVVQGD